MYGGIVTSAENENLVDSEYCALLTGQYFLESFAERAQSVKVKLPAGEFSY